jgi:hypothetical protein
VAKDFAGFVFVVVSALPADFTEFVVLAGTVKKFTIIRTHIYQSNSWQRFVGIRTRFGITAQVVILWQ